MQVLMTNRSKYKSDVNECRGRSGSFFLGTREQLVSRLMWELADEIHSSLIIVSRKKLNPIWESTCTGEPKTRFVECA